MIIIRPVTHDDLPALKRFAESAEVGMTHLPNNRTYLEKLIADSCASFSKKLDRPTGEVYMFVLEDTESHTLYGTSSILSKTGIHKPLYSYQVEMVPVHPCASLPLPSELKILYPKQTTNGPSELCGLFLTREFRRSNLGRLLSLSRLLFIAAFPHRFDSSIFAEMNGIKRKDGSTPFWDAIGRHMLDIEYSELMKLYELEIDAIGAILPQLPIYAFLLPKEAQEAIGEVSYETMPALHMLTNEGLSRTNEIDIFDGGPRLQGVICSLRTVCTSSTADIEEVVECSNKELPLYLLSNDRIDFRACLGEIEVDTNQSARLSRQVVDALHLKPGDTIRYALYK